MKAARTRARNAKHAGTRKHSATSKHTPTATKKAATAHKQTARRTAKQVKAAHLAALSLGGVACCSALAVAESARLSGLAVSDSAVAALHRAADGSDSAGASVWAALAAAPVAGLPRPEFAPLDLRGLYVFRAGLILHLALPEGPHAVTVAGDGCWLSWGRHYDPWPDAVVEQAWVVAWP